MEPNVGAVMFLVQNDDRKRRQRRKRQNDLGTPAVTDMVMMTAIVVMTVVMAVVMFLVSAIPMFVMARIVAARVVRASVATITMSPVRGKRRRSEGQGGDQQCYSNSLSAIHGSFSFLVWAGLHRVCRYGKHRVAKGS